MVAILNEFDESALADLGFGTKQVTSESFVIHELEGSGEIAVWRIGEWLQFRLNVVEPSDSLGCSVATALSDTINRMHDLALGARVVLADDGRVTLVSDVLHSTVTNQVAATYANQILFLADVFDVILGMIVERELPLSSNQIDELFENWQQ